MGDAYVNMTLENISNNDPMAVYKETEEIDMFLGITINNVRVALFTFVAGLILGIGTLYVLCRMRSCWDLFNTFFTNRSCFGNRLGPFGYMERLRYR